MNTRTASLKTISRLSRPLLWVVLGLALTLTFRTVPVAAKGPPKPVQVTLKIGADGDQLTPAELRFERGRLYKLTVSNHTDTPRYFVATEMAGKVFTAKVEVYAPGGKMAGEVHGQAHRFEVSPGASIGWFFYPMARGSDLPITSTRRDTPAMTGKVEIFGAPPIMKP